MQQNSKSTDLNLKTSLLQALKLKLLQEVFSNWRLVLLGVTGLVLSVASGWTTWAGMNNFTHTPLLSGLITFGIQGVMLVTAWLIGESFAHGATGEEAGKRGKVDILTIAKKAFFLLFSVAAIIGVVYLLAVVFEWVEPETLRQTTSWVRHNLPTILVTLAAILALALMLVLFSEADIIGPYARGIRTILSHLPLWVMFLSCMATSVFFSFDALFSSIFPEEERRRAGELRAQNHVTGIIQDLTARLEEQRSRAVEALFGSAPWKAYEKNLNTLIQIARSAPAAVEERFIEELKKRQTSLAKQKVSLSEARATSEKLAAERKLIERKLVQAEKELETVQEDVAKFRSEQQAKKRELEVARAAAEAELRGVGSTGRSGRGPRYRELQKVVVRTEIEYNVIKKQLDEARGKYAALEKRIANLRDRSAKITRKLSELKTKELAAKSQIEAQERLKKQSFAPTVQAAAGFKTLEKLLTEFRQKPTQKRLLQIQAVCGDLRAALIPVPKLAAGARAVECDPGAVNDGAARVFAANKALTAFWEQCGDARKMPTETDALIAFAQRCILSSGLPSAVTREYRRNINQISLNRDDKAKNFVVTWNAFLDGNKLAYLALAIAIAIDSLVFMSGLFGANILTSPLAGSPKARGQPIPQLQAIVDNALLPDKAYAAELTLNLMVPYSHQNDQGYMAEIELEGLVPDQFLQVRKVMLAGANLGLVWRDPHSKDRFLIRSELFEYLSIVRAREAKLGHVASKDPTPRWKGEEAFPVSDIHDVGVKQGEILSPQQMDLLINPPAPANDDEMTHLANLERHKESQNTTPSEQPEEQTSLPASENKGTREIARIDTYSPEREEEWYAIREAFRQKLKIRLPLGRDLQQFCSGAGGETPEQMMERFSRQDIDLQNYFIKMELTIEGEIDQQERALRDEKASRPDLQKYVSKVAAEFREKKAAIILFRINDELQQKAVEVRHNLQRLIDSGLADDYGTREQIEYYLGELAQVEETRCRDMMKLRETIRHAREFLEQTESADSI